MEKVAVVVRRDRTKELLISSVDKLGVWASTLCLVHCIAMPVLFSLSISGSHFLPSEERTHRALAVTVALLGGIAAARGYRSHRRWSVLVLMAGGLGCVTGTAWLGDRFATHRQEVEATLLGGCLMIAAHLRNHSFCNDCECGKSTDRSPAETGVRLMLIGENGLLRQLKKTLMRSSPEQLCGHDPAV